jgi:hypothetical protein
MYGLCFGAVECSLTIAGVSCTRIDCWRRTMGELVGKAPHRAWSPNMLPKQLPRGEPLPSEAFCQPLQSPQKINKGHT